MDSETFYNYVMGEMEKMLIMFMGIDAYEEFSAKVAKEGFRREIESMEDGDFKSFVLDNFDTITEDGKTAFFCPIIEDEAEYWAERYADEQSDEPQLTADCLDCSNCKWDDKDNGCPWAQMCECKHEPKDEPQTDYELSKDSEAYKINKRMEIEDEWLKLQTERSE